MRQSLPAGCAVESVGRTTTLPATRAMTRRRFIETILRVPLVDVGPGADAVDRAFPTGAGPAPVEDRLSPRESR